MATIVWGSWVANSRWRIGIETYYSPTSISASTSAVTVYTNIWFQVQYSSSESGQSGTTVKLTSPYAAGPVNFDWSLGSNGTKKILTTSRSYSLNYGSTQKLTMTGSATVSYTYPGTGSATTTLTLPARPLSAPAAPTGVTLTRGSGESLSGAWTNRGTSAAPVTNNEVQWYNTKGTAWYNGSTSVAGSATSYSTTGTTDRKYKMRVRAKNSAGYSAWVESAYTSTTPAVPATPSAAKNSIGDIVVTLPAPASGSSAVNYDVWHSANGVWDAAKLGTVSATAGTYTHAAPNTSQTHAYRLRAVSSSPTLTSADSGTSNTVQLQAPPAAPTNLSPNGPTVDASKDNVFSWQHNPTDTTPQTYRENRWKLSTDSVWNQPGRFQTNLQSRTYTAGTFPAGTIEWQTRTWGAATTGGTGNGDSPWSTSAFFLSSTPPSASISTPDGSVPVATSVLTVTWGYTGPSAQAQWKATLYDSNGIAIQQLSGAGTDSTATFTKPVKDSSAYTIGVQVQAVDGLWSAEDIQPITVDFLEPPSPIITPTWDSESGSMMLDVAVPGPQAADSIVRKNYSPNPAYRGTAGTAAVRTNRFLNPNLKTNTSYWSMAQNTNTFTASTVTTGDGPLLPNGQTLNFYRMTCTAAGAGANSASTGPIVGAAATDGATVLASKQHCVTMYYRTSRARDVQLVTTFSDNTGATVGSTAVGPIVSVPANTWVRLQNVFTTAATATRSMTRAYPNGTAVNVVAGDTIDATAVLVEADCNTPLPYFDGDSPALADESGWTCSWASTAGASVSYISGALPNSGSPRAYGSSSWYGAKVDGVDAYRLMFLGGNQAGGSIMAWTDAATGLKTLVAGEFWSARLQMRVLPGGSAVGISARIGVYAPSFTSNISNTGADVFTVQPDGNWVDITATAAVPVASGLTTPTARTMLYLTSIPTSGTTVELRYHLMQTVEAAGVPAGDYFDGSTPTVGDWRHYWDGAVDNSFSTEFIQQQVDAVSVNVFRSTDLQTWDLVGSTTPNTTFVDSTPPLNDIVYYRGDSLSALPSVATGRDTSVQTDSERIVFVNAGPGLATFVKLKHNLSSDEDAGLVNREMHRFAGRKKAVSYSGIEEERSISIKGTLYGVVQGDPWSEAAVALERAKSSSWEEIVAFSKLPTPMVLRTSWGVRTFVTPGKPSISGRGEIEQQVSWNFEESDDGETL